MNYTEYWLKKIANQKVVDQVLIEKARLDVK